MMIDAFVNTDNGKEANRGIQAPDKLGVVYRHSEQFKTDISVMIAAEAMTPEELIELFFDVVQDSTEIVSQIK
jgi:hypothetical protein